MISQNEKYGREKRERGRKREKEGVKNEQTCIILADKLTTAPSKVYSRRNELPTSPQYTRPLVIPIQQCTCCRCSASASINDAFTASTASFGCCNGGIPNAHTAITPLSSIRNLLTDPSRRYMYCWIVTNASWIRLASMNSGPSGSFATETNKTVTRLNSPSKDGDDGRGTSSLNRTAPGMYLRSCCRF